MGRMNADAMAEAVSDGTCTLAAALAWHLTANHFPPIKRGVPAALKALEAVQAGDPERIVIREGETQRGKAVTAAEVVEAWHLESFLGIGDPREERLDLMADDAGPEPETISGVTSLPKMEGGMMVYPSPGKD